MVGGRTAGRLITAVMGLVCGIVLATAVRSQQTDDVAALDAEVARL
jgi:hypothetical protein